MKTMEINLRKANALQNEVKSALGDLEVSSQVKVTEFETPTEVIDAARARNEVARKKWLDLNSALFEIRKKIGAANVEGGISDALADISMIEGAMSMLRGQSHQAALQMDEKVLTGRIEKLKTAPADNGMRGYGTKPDDSVTTGIFSQEEIEAYVAEIAKLKREKRDLQDSLLGLNVSTKITLSEGAVAALTAAGIV
jgi:predicted  nucleic acid-binding Zn-ribbon protein